MDFEIPLVIDEETLNLIPEYENTFVKFLLFWLQERDCKAIVLKSAWKNFFKKWDINLKDTTDEIKEPFYGFIRGVVRPYKKDGYENEKEDSSPIKQITKIVNRDYDVIEFLIVSNPSLYNEDEIKISNNLIMSIKDFYNFHRVKNSEIFKLFSDLN